MYRAEDLIGPLETARLLGVSSSRLAQLVRARELLPVVELARCRIYARADVRAFAAKRAEQAARDPRARMPVALS